MTRNLPPLSLRTEGSQAGNFLREQSSFKLGDSYFFNLYLWHCIYFLRALADTRAGPCMASACLAGLLLSQDGLTGNLEVVAKPSPSAEPSQPP